MVIPVLVYEREVQLDDKTRLDARKSFYTKDELTAITSILITPEASGLPIEVFNADPDQWFLDWIFDTFVTDIDSTNNQVYFQESGVDLIGVIANGSYTKTTFLTALITAMNTVATGVFSASIDSNDKITLSSTNQFILNPGKGPASILENIGFQFPEQNTTNTQTGLPWEFVFKKVSVTADNGTNSSTKNYYIKLYSEHGDYLWSNDDDMVAKEPQIMNWVRDGRSSFLDLHRVTQADILDFLNRQGYETIFGKKLTKWAITDQIQMRDWSLYNVLGAFFAGQSNVRDDVFAKKANQYKGQEIEARNIMLLELDLTGDGVADKAESPTIYSGSLMKR